MEKIVFKTDFKILKRKLIKVFIFIVILCLWMFVPNIQNFPVNESSIHLKIIIFPILSAIFILLFEVLKRKAQIIESNILIFIRNTSIIIKVDYKPRQFLKVRKILQTIAGRTSSHIKILLY